MFRTLLIMLAVGCGLAAVAPQSARALVPPPAPGLAAGVETGLVAVRYRRHWRRHHRHHRRWHRHRHHRHWHHHRRHRHAGHGWRHRTHRALDRGSHRPLRFDLDRGAARRHDPVRSVRRPGIERSLTPRLD